MAGTYLYHFTFERSYSGNIQLTKANPKFVASAHVVDQITQSVNALTFESSVTDNDKIPFFVVNATNEEPGFAQFYYYNTTNEIIYEPPQSICSGQYLEPLPVQGGIIGVPFGTTGDGETYDVSNIDTNIPIFLSRTDAENWISGNYRDNTNIVNYNPDYESERRNYYIYNKYGDAVAKNSGIEFTGTIFERYEDFTIDGLACLLMPTPFEMSIVTRGSVAYSTFSSIGRGIEEVERENELYYSSPFYNIWDRITTGNIRVSQNFLQTNMLIFRSMDDINDYFDGVPDAESKADNYDDIANGGGTSVVNKTGSPDEETIFGHPSHGDILTTRYVMTKNAITLLKTKLFDDANIHDIVEALQYWNKAPIEALADLTYYPFDVRSVVQTGGSSDVYLGNYRLVDVSGLPINSYDGYIDIGEVFIQPSTNSYRDFEPYTKLYIYLPYIGIRQLAIDRVYKKVLKIRYFIDFNTRGCCACIIVDGKLVDYHNGQIGITVPLSQESFSSYANSQVSSLLQLGANTGVSASGGAMMGGGLGAILGGSVGLASGVIDIASNHKENFNNARGSSSSMINELLPQYCYLIWEIASVSETTNHLPLEGKPSNASGKISNFTGFLQVNSVDLSCSGATDSEKQEILSMLQSGIRI